MNEDLRDWKTNRDKVALPVFFPQVAIQVKALACELPYKSGVPLSHFSTDEIAREVVNRGIVAKISSATIWRWLNEDAIKPWQHRCWIFPRAPEFKEKANRVLDLYHGIWDGQPLGHDEYIISADEKTSIQARIRKHATQPTRVENCMRVEQVMSQEPYCSAKRVFWIIDNGSSHRGKPSTQRLQNKWPNIIPVHLPIHASWLNQVEIYFSIIQRKVLTPNDFSSLDDVQTRLFQFQERYEQIVKPFEWKFTKNDLSDLLVKIPSVLDSLALSA